MRRSPRQGKGCWLRKRVARRLRLRLSRGLLVAPALRRPLRRRGGPLLGQGLRATELRTRCVQRHGATPEGVWTAWRLGAEALRAWGLSPTGTKGLGLLLRPQRRLSVM